MGKFIDIKLDDEMYSIVFGLGKVVFVLAKPLRLDGYFMFEVEYENGQRTHYTEDGRARWCKDLRKCISTVYYKHEVNFDDFDVTKNDNILKKYEIDKLRDDSTLEMMSPAGAWIDANLMPDFMVENAINNGEYHLFREIKN